MSKNIRAKMRCHSIEDTGSENYPQQTVHMIPVYAEGGNENTSFAKATPAGNLNLVIDNPDAFEAFEAGKDYYVDIAEVPGGEAPAPAESDTPPPAAGDAPPASSEAAPQQ